MVFPPTHPFQTIEGAVEDLGDIEDLIKREKTNELFSSLSSSFNTTGTKITRIVPNLKTFYLVKAKLHPAETAIKSGGGACLAEIRYDGTAVAFLGYQVGMRQSTLNTGAGVGRGVGLGGQGSDETGIIADSMVGNGVKTVTVEVINISGDFRIELQGIEETT